MWRRRALFLLKPLSPSPHLSVSFKPFSSSSSTTNQNPEPPSLYSFLKPSLFSVHHHQQPPPTTAPTTSKPPPPTKNDKSSLEATLQLSIASGNTDEAWKCFKTLINSNSFPSKYLTNLLITQLSNLGDLHNLKRSFASLVYIIEKNPNLVEFDTVKSVLECMLVANAAAPAFSFVKCMLKNRFYVPFDVWGPLVVEISRKSGSLKGYLSVFHECCRVSLEEGMESLRPDLPACNVALEACCFEVGEVREAEKVVELMSLIRVRPDEVSFGFLGYLYALKGRDEKVGELEGLMGCFGFEDKTGFVGSVIRGSVKGARLEAVGRMMLRGLKEGDGKGLLLDEETYCEVVKGYLEHGSVKELAGLIVGAQLLETESVVVERSVGFGVVNACVQLGMLDKAHIIMDEMKAQGAAVGLGVYLSILRGYCKVQRTAEAAQLVMQINSSGFQLEASCYDSLIEASMASQDFQSAFSLFRDMKGTRLSELKGSYLTIMTGLTENNRPELMAAFLDEVVEDPRIEVGTHDWNSIIHAFCKAGRMEDAQRTLRRMAFLRYEPNQQTYLSMINGYASITKYFNVLMLWNDVKKHMSTGCSSGFKLDHCLVDAFISAMVKGGFFDAVMQVVDTSRELKIFVDKWRYKQAFMENHKKLRISKLRKKNIKKMEALIAFKNWVGLNA